MRDLMKWRGLLCLILLMTACFGMGAAFAASHGVAEFTLYLNENSPLPSPRTESTGASFQFQIITPLPAPENTPEPESNGTVFRLHYQSPAPTPVPTPVPTEPPMKDTLLPVDSSRGSKPQKNGYSGDKETTWTYQDPTISVSIIKGRIEGTLGCAYWVATVEIKDPSQLRTASRNGFDESIKIDAITLAKRSNAVLAINGDYYSYTGKGLIIRQGVAYLDLLDGDRDILLIDEDGDFHGIKAAQKGCVSSVEYSNGNTVYYYRGKRIINAFYFGPLLVINGKLNQEMQMRSDMAAADRKQRMAIAQIGPLKYMCICCAPPANGNDGMDLKTFANLVAQQNVKIAYNLDGGYSTWMILGNEQVNNTADSNRELMDIIYFASAYGD